ncbi:unnamed protein product [Pseudo-nitzschia multistriata]|uniref:Uncharacterized protein n=1 Tax=Pseudo-nitzschia multistriata TaxID=183589 RepID=A0A448YYT9_9STRA|nr:unnamed protein product [Pseudo-nitzschia multistriata]
MVKNKEGFYSFGPQQVVGCASSGSEVVCIHVKLNKFWTDSCRHSGITLIARALWVGVGSESKQTTHEANQMIHFVIHTSVIFIGNEN